MMGDSLREKLVEGAAVLTLNYRLLNVDQDVRFLAAHRSAGPPAGGDQDTPA